jgi:hypothetical protein
MHVLKGEVQSSALYWFWACPGSQDWDTPPTFPEVANACFTTQTDKGQLPHGFSQSSPPFLAYISV